MRIATAILTLVLGVIVSGCSLIGLGIGAAVPKYSERVDPRTLPAGARVLVTEVGLVETNGTFVSASNANARNADVTIDADQKRITIRGEVRRRDGTYWEDGLTVGVVIDFALLVAGGILAAVAMTALSNMRL
jgi:hypothetical protein